MRTTAPVKLLRSTFIIFLLAATSVMARDEDELGFVPPADATPGQRRDITPRGLGVAAAPSVMIIAPFEKVGQTFRDQPVIYWYLSKATDRRVRIVLNNTTTKSRVFATELDAPTKRGIQRLDLAGIQIDGQPLKLEPKIMYKVFVTVVMDEADAARNPSSAAGIERVNGRKVPPDIEKERDPKKLAALCGRSGLWFDYIDALNTAIAKDASNTALVRQREKVLAGENLMFEPARDNSKPLKTADVTK